MTENIPISHCRTAASRSARNNVKSEGKKEVQKASRNIFSPHFTNGGGTGNSKPYMYSVRAKSVYVNSLMGVGV